MLVHQAGAILIALVCVSLFGCGQATMPPPAPASPVQASAPLPPVPPPPAPPATSEVANIPAAGEVTNRVKAEAGVGKKGRDYGGGVVTEAVRVNFTIQQRIVFNTQIPHAMNLFKATHDRLPRSHEEFMREIIAANSIALPELPACDKYFYDPMLGELMVEQSGR